MNIGFLEIDPGDNGRSWSGEKEDKFPFLSSLTNNGAFHGSVLNEKGMQNMWTENVDLKNHPWMSSYVEVCSFQSWRPSGFGKQLESFIFSVLFLPKILHLFSQVGFKCFIFKWKYSNIPFLPICTELVSWWGKLIPKAFLYSGLSVREMSSPQKPLCTGKKTLPSTVCSFPACILPRLRFCLLISKDEANIDIRRF